MAEIWLFDYLHTHLYSNCTKFVPFVTLFLKNWYTNFDETLHVAQAQTQEGFSTRPLTGLDIALFKKRRMPLHGSVAIFMELWSLKISMDLMVPQVKMIVLKLFFFYNESWFFEGYFRFFLFIIHSSICIHQVDKIVSSEKVTV